MQFNVNDRVRRSAAAGVFTPAIQIMETAENQPAAIEIFTTINIQDGILAARIIEPSPAKPEWRVQAIMETNGEYPNGWLPDGMRHVLWRGTF
jgi:hypothetical protein